MSEISLDEFKKLNIEEQRKRYKDMSDHDKYIFRLTDPAPFLNAKTIGHIEMTDEEKRKNEIKKKRLLKQLEEIRKN